jgi:hypothetical protein
MTMHLLLAVLVTALPEAQKPSNVGPLPACPEGVRVVQQPPYPNPPPVRIPRPEAPRLMIFVHGLQGDGTKSWMSRSGAYWPALVASDPAFKDFDIFVHEYAIPPSGPMRLGEAAEQFVQVAHKNGLVSQYRDVVFVVEGDGVYFVRELLKRVRPFAARATMIFAAGRIDEVARKVDKSNLQIAEGKELLKWSDYVRSDAVAWSSVEPKPWIHCAVLDSSKQATVARDDASSFCSTMPLAVVGKDWQALRPSCYSHPVYQALRRSVGQYGLPTAQVKAQPAATITAETKPLSVPCEQRVERLIEVPLKVDPKTEDILSYKATIQNADKLKEATAEVVRVFGNVAIVKYTITGLDLVPGGQASGQPACPTGQATVSVHVMKRPKG